jgi:hypothetical protein
MSGITPPEMGQALENLPEEPDPTDLPAEDEPEDESAAQHAAPQEPPD